MADFARLSELVLVEPGVRLSDGKQLAFEVEVRGKFRSLCWQWLERPVATRPRVANPDVWAFRTRSLELKEQILLSDPRGRTFLYREALQRVPSGAGALDAYLR